MFANDKWRIISNILILEERLRIDERHSATILLEWDLKDLNALLVSLESRLNQGS